ncbi:hypothetical protein METBIDRAFT_114380 [Metschnikowia bicuspidata var. bicuspidata NRRL YB-4993]|uniref:Uncharacterized protein n=1 Tax=Metschnikowia bicuspidata var. bicuspidata NRRL YB-4993 TaxID=869754 RepID=A0A1A0HI61_9ASCO|nr:hypothetical protein METBIDRAFT_114380 [Metschnikowia bicuspidata var. bicuspidata NRRL YB-4993]OBA23854.1 hypothetical protein METBIDRAFT_114380 [Metschnikowia bicuspidata var. bicuspidata NRRL YB-4993]
MGLRRDVGSAGRLAGAAIWQDQRGCKVSEESAREQGRWPAIKSRLQRSERRECFFFCFSRGHPESPAKEEEKPGSKRARGARAGSALCAWCCAPAGDGSALHTDTPVCAHLGQTRPAPRQRHLRRLEVAPAGLARWAAWAHTTGASRWFSCAG